ncbi:MAG: cobyrinate a,c-diamide synthase [Chloroflexaceae bacterium]|nr:cobyrinate a,c-diamide synthase [Chloroflexaceae bacterium]
MHTDQSYHCPRLLIAAPMSGSGKTTLMAGLIKALASKGLRVAPCKVGPDYIDPTYHSLAAERPCHNLDAWMLPPDLIPTVLAQHTRDADVTLIEGVMGLFDGYGGRDDSGSSAHIARITDTPVLIVLDVRSQARTAAALVHGLRDFDRSIHVAGVILNRVGSPKHARMVTEAIEGHVGIPVLGALGREETLHLPERHLGLIPTAEPGRWRTWLQQAADLVTAHIDLEQLLALAASASPLLADAMPVLSARTRDDRTVIAVARDPAFSFLYEDNLTLLRQAGATIAFFSPMHDQALPPNTRALYLCGGFPELYAEVLSHNQTMRTAIRQAAAVGMPVYAECGGLMYLTEAITDQHEQTHAMVGVIPGQSVMSGRLTLGYRTIEAVSDNWLWQTGEIMRGHEFHYSTWHTAATPLSAYTILPDEWRPEPRREGIQTSNVIASYIHLHFLAYPELAMRFVAAAAAWQPRPYHLDEATGA